MEHTKPAATLKRLGFARASSPRINEATRSWCVVASAYGLNYAYKLAACRYNGAAQSALEIKRAEESEEAGNLIYFN